MPTIETVTGSVSTNGQGSLTLFATYKRNAAAKELTMQQAEQDPRCEISSAGRPPDIQPSGNTRMSKQWIGKRNNYPEGSYIKFSVQRMLNSGVFRIEQHGFVIRARANAPLHRIDIELPVDNSTTRSMLNIEGRFDIIPFEEIEEKGLHLGSNGKGRLEDFDPDNFADYITFNLLEKALAPLTKVKMQEVTAKDGSKKVMPRIGGGRILRF